MQVRRCVVSGIVSKVQGDEMNQRLNLPSVCNCSTDELLFWLSVGISLNVVAIVFFIWIRRLERVYRTKWYDLAKDGPNEDMAWCDIATIMDTDPLNGCPPGASWRFPWKYICWDVLGVVTLFVLFSLVVFLLYRNEDVVALLGALVALPAIVGTFITVLYQVRLKARSANRQDWITSIRRDIELLIVNFPPPDASTRRIDEIYLVIQKHLIALELYLNPSEKMHRALLAVLRFMYGASNESVDTDARNSLYIPSTRQIWRHQDYGNAKSDWLKWRLRAIRLSNALLKREWEQVKHVR